MLPEKYAAFKDVFDEKEAEQLPPHRPFDCTIDLIPGASLSKGRLIPLSEPELAALRDFLDVNLKKGFIRPSRSPVGAPSFFVKKKGTKQLRLVVDYKAINNQTISDSYPLPLIPEMLECLGQASIFTRLDLRGAYNLIRIREGDEWKTTFLTRYGAYGSLVMPFGFKKMLRRPSLVLCSIFLVTWWINF